uniref:Growth-regulating factor n=1 Tax=Chenopodium quinoa TaxID=63459 RepID=A0A803M8G5_CHEQI
MSIATATAAGGGRTKFPFTATQWQELEHQALIYKYMAAGIPIPSDLLFTVKRSLDSSISSKLFPYQPSPLGWNPYQMGYGKKIDPEPGRCRRTDVASAAASLTNQSLLSKNPCSVSSASLFSLPSPDSSCNSLYPPFKNSHKDYNRERYYQGLKEEVGEHAFFTDSSGSSMRGFSGSSMEETWQLGNLDHHSKQSGGYPNYLQQLNNGSAAAAAKQQQEKQCYIWGRDFNCDLSMKVEDERENFHEKTTHHFFDEWPIKGGGGRGGRENSWLDSSSTTQLSISIPNSSSHHHDFFLTNSRET